MARPLTDSPCAKIVVALDAATAGPETLIAAIQLAARLRAELEGLFVEDINLIRVAELPFAQEVGIRSPAWRPLNVDMMERTLRGLADRMRLRLAELAKRQQVPWSFQVTRGQLARLPDSLLESADLILFGNQPHIPVNSSGFRPRSPARVVPGPLLVIYEGTAASRRALEIAIELESHDANGLIVLLGGQLSEADLREQVTHRLTASGQQATIATLAVSTSRQILEAVRRVGGRLVLGGRDSGLLDEATLTALVTDIGCPVGQVCVQTLGTSLVTDKPNESSPP